MHTSLWDILLFAAIIGVIPGLIARSKGRDFIPWWLYGSLFFILALPHSLLMRSTARRCPFCAEKVRKEASVCSHCARPIGGNGISDVSEKHDLGAYPMPVASLPVKNETILGGAGTATKLAVIAVLVFFVIVLPSMIDSYKVPWPILVVILVALLATLK